MQLTSQLWAYFVSIITMIISPITSVLRLVLGFGFYKKSRIAALKDAMANASSYDEYQHSALELDELTGKNAWKQDPKSSIYDWEGISRRLDHLAGLYERKDWYELRRQLRAGLVRNAGGIGDRRLHFECNTGTKELIERYVAFVCKALETLASVDPMIFPIDEKFSYFYETRQAFGRSALCLSGGATFGLYHLGVIKVLFENRLLPRVISGSSVGSIIAAFVSTRKDEELPDMFDLKGINFNAFESKGSTHRKIWRFLTDGVIMDIQKLEKMIRDNVGDYTFKEAYDRTKRILNITVASTTPYETPCLLNYLTAPNVLIWSAAAASCALTFLYKPVELMAKDIQGNIVPYTSSGLLWADGSMATDLPMERLSELFNINHFIVSQVNPHVVPFLWMTKNWGIIGNILRDELQFRLTQVFSLFSGSSILGFRQLASIFNQQYTGDITIVPDLTADDYKRLLSNPQVDWMLAARQRAERKTWQQLGFIKHHCAIELTLDRCLRKISKDINRSDQGTRLVSLYKRYK